MGYSKLFVSFLLLLFISCFPVSLDQFDVNNTSNYYSLITKKVLIQNQNCTCGNSEGLNCNNSQDQFEYVGHQYLFAIIPISILYEPICNFNREELLLYKTLTELGYRVEMSNQLDSDVPNQFNYILSVKRENLSVSTYDALFFRIPRISGIYELSVKQLVKESYQEIKYPINIEFTSYQSYYFADQLSIKLNHLLENKFRSIINDSF